MIQSDQAGDVYATDERYIVLIPATRKLTGALKGKTNQQRAACIRQERRPPSPLLGRFQKEVSDERHIEGEIMHKQEPGKSGLRFSSPSPIGVDCVSSLRIPTK